MLIITCLINHAIEKYDYFLGAEHESDFRSIEFIELKDSPGETYE